MATQETIIKAVAGESMASAQYHAVYVDGADAERVKIADGAADAYNTRFLGIVQNAPADDEVAEVCTQGFCFAKAGAAIEPYDLLQVENSTGRLIPLDEGICVGQYIPGLVDATATGRDAADTDEVYVYLFPGRKGTFTISATIDFGSCDDGNIVESSAITVTGVEVGDTAQVSCDGLASGWMLWANVDAANSVVVHAFNATGGTVDLASDTYYITITKKA